MSILKRITDGLERGVLFSDCGKYRYKLWRRWSDKPPLVFIMLNPSTADLLKNDPTIERCERRTRMLGFGAIYVGNAFAFRATQPDDMKAHDDPIGNLNDASLRALMNMAKWSGGKVIVGWGKDGGFRGRSKEVVDIALDCGVQLYCLAYCKNGQPQHPLYIPYEEKMKPWPRTYRLNLSSGLARSFRSLA